MSDANTALSLRSVCKHFGGVGAVEDVSLDLASGEVMCLLGPSGCGKSTTLRLAAGVEQPSEGEIHIGGQLVASKTRITPPEARGVGLMFQDFALFPHLNVQKNIAFGLKGSTAAKAARVGELLEKVDLVGFGQKYPHELSGGEQQRVALARALAPRPAILLMDEPFSGLDDRLRDGVRDATLNILRAEGISALLVTHEPAEAMRMADRIALMFGGKLAQVGAPSAIYTQPVSRSVAGFFSDLNTVHGAVRGGVVETPIGAFAADGFEDGAAVEVVFRPQHLRIAQDGSASATVTRARFLGTDTLVEMTTQSGLPLVASSHDPVLPQPGAEVSLHIPHEHCMVFGADG